MLPSNFSFFLHNIVRLHYVLCFAVCSFDLRSVQTFKIKWTVRSLLILKGAFIANGLRGSFSSYLSHYNTGEMQMEISQTTDELNLKTLFALKKSVNCCHILCHAVLQFFYRNLKKELNLGNWISNFITFSSGAVQTMRRKEILVHCIWHY